MALIHVYNGIGQDVTTYEASGVLKDALPSIDWEHALILKAGKAIPCDYQLQDDDIIFIRILPAAATSILIATTVLLAVAGIAAGVVVGVKMYEQRQQLEALQKAQKNAKAKNAIEQLPFVKGAQNRAATGQYFPYTIGESLFTPYLLCPSYYSVEGARGEDQYLNLVLECGFNDILIKKLQMKNTSVKTWNTETPQNGVYNFDAGTYYDSRNRIEIRQTGDFTIDAFNKKIIGVGVNKQIPHEHAGDDAEENARIEKEWQAGVVQELASHPMAVEVIVLFDGLRKFEDDAWKAQSVTLLAEWTNNPEDAEPVWTPFDSGFIQNGTVSNTFEYNTKKQMRYCATQTFTASQSYGKKISVRVKRVTPKAKSNSQENVILLAVQTTCYDAKKSSASALVAAQVLEADKRDKCTRIGIRVIANENTADMLDSFSVIQSGAARTWDKDTRAWSTTKAPTRNLAAWALEILTSPHHKPSQYADDELDLASFGAWYEYCEKEGFYADGVITRGEKKKNTIDTLCQNGNAALIYNEFTGKIEAAIDNGRPYSVALLNSENIISIQTSKDFKRKTDGKKVTYINRDAGYDADSVVFMRNGKEYNPETDTITTTALKYITDYNMAYKYVWRQMAEEAASPRTVVVKVGAEGAYYPLFSRVEVQHRALPVGLSHSVVKEVTWRGGLLKTITLDGYVDFPEGKRCGVLIHCIDNKGHGICAVEVAGVGKTDTLKVVSKVRQSADSIPHSGDVLSFGILDADGGFQAVTRTMKIVNIEPADHGYSLTLKDYNPALYEYGKLPEYKSNITYIPDGNPKPHTPDKGYVTRDELKKVNEQAVKQAALEAAAKAAQAAIDVIARGDTFSDVFQLNGYGTSLENLIDKMDEDARNAKDGLSITKDEILLKVSDTEDALRAYLKLTKETILARVEDDKNQLNSTILQTKKAILAQVRDDKNQLLGKLDVQAGALHALVKGGGAQGQMALTVNLPVIIDDATRQKLIKASTLEKVNAVYAKVQDTDYYGIKGNAGAAIKPLWEDARRATLLASQISLEADQIQFKSDSVFVNGKLKADYIDVLELAVKKTFTEELVVQKLHIDSDDTTDQDFEIDVNERVGFLAKNNNTVIFSISPTGGAYFSGSVYAGPLELDNTPEKIPSYQKDTVSTLELVSYLYNKQHIPMTINIKGTVYTLRTVKLEETPKKPDGNITRENLKGTFGNSNYYLHITKNNGYRGYFVCDVYRHIKYSIISYILLSGDVKYEYQETADWWEKIASDVYHSYLSDSIPKNSSNNAPSITYDNSKKENPIIHNINIEFSPSHKLFKLNGLPEKTAGLSKGSVYMENGFLKIV
ncbi:hypothetical protein E4N70_02240 [Treponema vincentii]|uniref:hypothetical protein n=1 Tax=Treponema vincentii TaxID=69710 RepID=UPI0020A52FCF|nr:hypothetical protein [Treponema vincentii]UTC60424.1 hypothetical protein E4N70_02240 [Treponema vincentii]